jgi:hypothetical protein
VYGFVYTVVRVDTGLYNHCVMCFTVVLNFGDTIMFLGCIMVGHGEIIGCLFFGGSPEFEE